MLYMCGPISSQELTTIRNEQQKKEFATPACDLFPDTPTTRTKKQRLSAAKIKELRQQPAVLTVTVPGFGEKPAMDVRMLRPINPRDDIAVPLHGDTLDHVFGFIRHDRMSVECLAKRPYKTIDGDVPKGIWRRGDTFVVCTATKRYRRAGTLEAAIELANSDGIDDAAIADGSEAEDNQLDEAEQMSEPLPITNDSA